MKETRGEDHAVGGSAFRRFPGSGALPPDRLKAEERAVYQTGFLAAPRAGVARLALALGLLAVLGVPVQGADKVTYQDHVLPILRNKCLKCHNPDKQKADLNMSTFQSLLKGSGNGSIVEGGDPDNSLMFKVVNHLEEPTMPPNDKLPDAELALIGKWISGGLLENSGSKAIASNKPKVEMTVSSEFMGKPEGPPPMPVEAFALDPYVRTERTSVSTALAVSPWSPLVAIGGQHQVLLYNTDTLRLEGVVPYPEGYPFDVKFSANGKLLIIGGGRSANMGQSVVWDITTGARILSVGEDYDSVQATDLSPDQQFIAHGGPDRLVRIFSTSSGALMHKIKKHTEWVTAVRFSPNGRYVATGDRNGGVEVWETQPGSPICTLNGHKDRITGIEWANTNILVTVSEDGNAKFWNTDEVREIKNWGAHGGGALSLARTQDGFLVTCGRDRKAVLWDANGGKKKEFTFPGDLPSRAVPSHDAKRVIGTDWVGNVYVWNAEDGKEVGQLSLNPLPMTEKLAALQDAARQREAEVVMAARTLEEATAGLASAEAALEQAKEKKENTDALAKSVEDQRKGLDEARGRLASMREARDGVLAELALAGKRTLFSDFFNARRTWREAVHGEHEILAAIESTETARVDSEKQLAAAHDLNLEEVKAGLAKGLEDTRQVAAVKQQEEAAIVVALGNAAEVLGRSQNTSELAATNVLEQEGLLKEAQALFATSQTQVQQAEGAVKSAQSRIDEQVAKMEAPATERLKKAEEGVAQAKAHMETAMRELAALETRITETAARRSEAETALASASAERERTRTDVDAFKPEWTQATAAAEEAAQKVAGAQSAYDALTGTKHKPTATMVASLERNLTDARQARETSAQLVGLFHAELRQAKAAAEEAQGAAEAAEAAAQPVRELDAKQALQVKENEAAAKASQAALDEVTAQIAALVKDTQAPLETRIASLTASIQSARESKEKNGAELTRIHASVKEALGSYQAAEVAAQEAELEAAQAEGGDEKVRLEKLAAELRHRTVKAKERLDTLVQKDQAPALAKVGELAEQLAADSTSRAAAQADLEQVGKQIAEATGRQTVAQTRLKESQEMLAAASATLASTRAELERKEAELTTRTTQAKARATELASVRNEKLTPAEQALTLSENTEQQLVASLDAGRIILASLDADVTSAQARLTEAQQAAKVAHDNAQPSRDRMTAWEAAAATAQQQVDDGTTKLAEVKGAHEQLANVERPKLEQALAAANGAITAADKERDESMTQLAAAQAKVQEAREAHQAARKKSEEMNAMAAAAKGAMETQMSELGKAKTGFTEAEKVVEGNVARHEEMIAKAAAAKTEAEAAAAEVVKAEVALATVEERHAAELIRLADLRERLSAEVVTVRRSLDATRLETLELEEKMEAARAAWERVKTEKPAVESGLEPAR